MTWDCNRAMAAKLAPGVTCAAVFAEGAKVERAFGLDPRPAGRTGHGYRNTGGLSIHPDCHTVLEPGMVISVEPMFANEYGYFDLEDQYLITEKGAECLHLPAKESLPIIT
jgi:Xaa-Pro aminopeptidase